MLRPVVQITDLDTIPAITDCAAAAGAAAAVWPAAALLAATPDRIDAWAAANRAAGLGPPLIGADVGAFDLNTANRDGLVPRAERLAAIAEAIGSRRIVTPFGACPFGRSDEAERGYALSGLIELGLAGEVARVWFVLQGFVAQTLLDSAEGVAAFLPVMHHRHVTFELPVDRVGEVFASLPRRFGDRVGQYRLGTGAATRGGPVRAGVLRVIETTHNEAGDAVARVVHGESDDSI